uniref:14 kDa protein n=1 Tax=Donkey orchid symptomless virus TaxID=1400526 RepID=A0A0F7KLC1_9VIRU|nr:14 kDa protein [Donkey orchid symptomless virus]
MGNLPPCHPLMTPRSPTPSTKPSKPDVVHSSRRTPTTSQANSADSPDRACSSHAHSETLRGGTTSSTFTTTYTSRSRRTGTPTTLLSHQCPSAPQDSSSSDITTATSSGSSWPRHSPKTPTTTTRTAHRVCRVT